MNVEMQICSECGNEKEMKDFPVDKRVKTGYKKICKECFSEKYKDRNKRNMDSKKIIKEYLKENSPDKYKAISIQSIAEEKDFLEVLIDCIQPKLEFLNLVNQYKVIKKNED